jgi:hypothetical protein
MMFCLPDIGQTAHMYLCCAGCTYVCGLAAPSMVGYDSAHITLDNLTRIITGRI